MSLMVVKLSYVTIVIASKLFYFSFFFDKKEAHFPLLYLVFVDYVYRKLLRENIGKKSVMTMS